MNQKEITSFLLGVPKKPLLKSEKPSFDLRKMDGRVAKKTLDIGVKHECTVILQDEDFVYSTEVININFNWAFLNCVARRMPRGVSRHDNAFIIVSKTVHSALWQVIVCYEDCSFPKLLWVDEERPEWLDKAIRL